jgi:hypothetical protein
LLHLTCFLAVTVQGGFLLGLGFLHEKIGVELSLPELASVFGYDEVKALRVAAMFELFRRTNRKIKKKYK